MPILNKRDCAALLGMAVQTLDSLMRRDPAFPVLRRGGKALAWQFDEQAVLAYQRKREAAADVGLKPSEQLALARVRQLERQEAVENGSLVPVEGVKELLTGAIIRLNRGLDAGIREALRGGNVPGSVIRQVEARMGATKSKLVDELKAYMTAFDQAAG